MLLRKVVATYDDSISDPEHSPFLKSFGQFKTAKIEEKEVEPYALLLEKFSELQNDISSIKQNKYNLSNIVVAPPSLRFDPDQAIHHFASEYIAEFGVANAKSGDGIIKYVRKRMSESNYEVKPLQPLIDKISQVIDLFQPNDVIRAYSE